MKPSDPSAPMFCLGLLPEHAEALARLRADRGLYQLEAGVLCSSLDAAIAVASIPFTMARDAAESLRFQSLHTSERIRSRKLDDVSEVEREQIAINKALEKMRAESSDAEVVKSHAKGISQRLNALLTTLGEGVAQLNSETLVMLWGAFEVFATDVIRKRLNLRPDEAIRLASEKPTKKRINIKSVPLEVLADFEFDLRERMGDLTLDNANLSSLETMKDILSVLFPSNEGLRQAMGAVEMRQLWKRRNLVAHRRGVVDRSYLAAAVDKLSLGDQLVVGRAEIETSLNAVLRASQAILLALSEDDSTTGLSA